jgi:hypothetical protein
VSREKGGPLVQTDNSSFMKMIVSSEEEFQHWRLTVQRDIGFQWRVQNSNKCNTRHFSCNRAGKAGNGM